MKKHLILFIFVFCLFSFVFTLWSQIPQTLSYQGVLKDAGGQIVPNDNYQLTFNLYTVENGGTAIWTEVQTVPVADGIFNVILGSLNPLTAEFDVPYWLGVAVETGTELPRIRLTAAAYSLNAKTVEDVAITTAKLADGAVTQVKLAPGLSLPPGGVAGGDLTGSYPNPTIAGNAVNSAKIQDGTIQLTDLAFTPLARPLSPGVATAEIADNAVTTAKIADGAVTQAKLSPGLSIPPGGTAGGDLSGTYPNPTIAAGAVNSTKIQDGQVGSADLANNAVATAKINDGAVTQAKIASGVTLPPSGTAGGDLSGTFPNPTVDGLQGRGVASTAPSSGQVLKWSGTSWSPAADETGTSLWTESGTNIYNNNSGNVGIGTTSPAYKLQVAGDVQVGYTNAYRIGAYTGLSWSASNGAINVGSPSSQPLQLISGTSVPRIYINNVNGRVGVGTLNPTARIHATTPGRYAGYFSADSLSENTHVIHSRYTGSGSYNAYALYSDCRPAAGYGYGGYFRGGYYGIYALADGGDFVSDYVRGIYCESTGSAGVRIGLESYAHTAGNVGYNYGIWGRASGGLYNFAVVGEASGEVSYAGYFSGNVAITGSISKGSGSFKIDHPLDPENKYLYHSFVESPDMKNIYDGVVILDNNGEAWIELPEWFEVLNRDFRYQLTCLGGYAPVYIGREISGNRFMIAGGTTGLKVSWQITGIRHDAYAEKNRIPVEELKRPEERGKYLHPSAFGLPENRGISYQLIKQAKER